MSNLRDEIAEIFGHSIDMSVKGAHEWTLTQADAVLAIPEIAEALRAHTKPWQVTGDEPSLAIRDKD